MISFEPVNFLATCRNISLRLAYIFNRNKLYFFNQWVERNKTFVTFVTYRRDDETERLKILLNVFISLYRLNLKEYMNRAKIWTVKQMDGNALKPEK